MPGPVPMPGDPHALGPAVGRLGNSHKKSSKKAIGILSVLLEEGELVECLVGALDVGGVFGDGAHHGHRHQPTPAAALARRAHLAAQGDQAAFAEDIAPNYGGKMTVGEDLMTFEV